MQTTGFQGETNEINRRKESNICQIFFQFTAHYHWCAKHTFTRSSSHFFLRAEIQEMKNHAEEKLREQIGIPPMAEESDQANLTSTTVVYPPLLIAYQAHLRPITSIMYANEREIIITSSVDCTIRLFTLTGRYIGYMGQSSSWRPLGSVVISKE